MKQYVARIQIFSTYLYTVLHMFTQLLFWARDQGNHQNFDPSFLLKTLPKQMQHSGLELHFFSDFSFVSDFHARVYKIKVGW